jgi:glutamate carboxypeptidase
VHAAARACSQLAELAVAGARCSVNIGTLGGGEAINARAREAWFEADFRADGADALTSLVDQARAIVAAADGGLVVEITELGRRPAGETGEISPLVRAAVAGHEKAGVPVRFGAASTDANAAHGAGIPAIAIGVTTGEGEHTPAEWIDTGPLAAGLTAVAETIRIFLQERP